MPRGRPRKTSHELKLFGNFRKDRHPDAPEPEGVPVKPEHLDELASAEWDRVVPLMAELGTLAGTDTAVLASYCLLYSQVVRLERFFMENPDMDCIEGKRGPQRHPRLTTLEKARTELRSTIAELGFSARSRRSVAAKTPVEASPYARKRG